MYFIIRKLNRADVVNVCIGHFVLSYILVLDVNIKVHCSKFLSWFSSPVFLSELFKCNCIFSF